MTDREIDRLADEYLAALDAVDYPTIDRIWELASSEPELEAALHEINLALDKEDRSQEDLRLQQPIADAVRKHLKSAEIVERITGPVTVCDVARELVRNPPAGLPAEAHRLIERLQDSREPLPDNLGLSNLTAWAQPRFGAGPNGFWKAFQDRALKLERCRASEVEYQLAARRAPKSEEPK